LEGAVFKLKPSEIRLIQTQCEITVHSTVARRFKGKKWVAETAFVIIGGSFGFFCDKETLQPQQR
jgi:hypothetical protein